MLISPSVFFSVIILNWNGRPLLEECLDSVLTQTFRDFETILVDNGSTDGSVEYLQDRYGDRIRIIPLDRNLGYGEGNNRGIEAAHGTWMVFLNNDTQVLPEQRYPGILPVAGGAFRRREPPSGHGRFRVQGAPL